MSNYPFRCLLNNLVDADSLILVSTEDPVYPKANLYNGRPSKPFRMTDSGGEIVVDLGAPAIPQVFVILNHNITAPASVTLEGNTVDEWIGAQTTIGTFSITRPHMWLYNTVEFRFFRLVFTGNDQFVSIGELMIGNCFELGNNYVWGKTEDPGIISSDFITDGGVHWGLTMGDMRSFELEFRSIDREKYREMVASLPGQTLKGFCWLHGDDESEAVYAVISRPKRQEQMAGDAFSLSLSVPSLGVVVS